MANRDVKEIKAAIANLVEVVAYISENSEKMSVKVIRLIDVITEIIRRSSKVTTEDAVRVVAFKTAIRQILDSLKQIMDWVHNLSTTGGIVDIKRVTKILISFSVMVAAVSKTSQKLQPYLNDVLIFADQLTIIVEKMNQLPTTEEDLVERIALMTSSTSRMLASLMSLAATIAMRLPFLTLLIKSAQSGQFDMLHQYVTKIIEILGVFEEFEKKHIKQIPKKMDLVREAVIALVRFIEYMASDISLSSVLIDSLSSKPIFKLLSNVVGDIFGIFGRIVGTNNWDAVLSGCKQLVKAFNKMVSLSKKMAKFGRRINLFKGSMLLTVAKFKLLHTAISDVNGVITIIASFQLLDYKKVLRSRLETLKELAKSVLDIADMLIDQKSKISLTDIPNEILLTGIFEVAEFTIRQMIKLLIEMGSIGSMINIIRSSIVVIPVIKRSMQSMLDIIEELKKIRKKISLQDIKSLLVVASKLGIVWLAIAAFMRVMEEISKFNIVRYGPIMVIKILFMRLSIKAIGLLIKTLLSLKLTAKAIGGLIISAIVAAILTAVLLIYYQLFDVITRSNLKQNFIARKKLKSMKITIKSVFELIGYIAGQVREANAADFGIMLLFIPISKLLQLVLFELYSLLGLIHDFKLIRDVIILKLKIAGINETLKDLNQLLATFAQFSLQSIGISVISLISILVFHILESLLIRLLSIFDLINDFGLIRTTLATWRIKRIIRFVDSLNKLIIEISKIGSTLDGNGLIELLLMKYKLKIVKSIIYTLGRIRRTLLWGRGKNDERKFNRMKNIVTRVADLIKHIIETFNDKELSFKNLLLVQIKLAQILALIATIILTIVGLIALIPLSILLIIAAPFVILATKLLVWTVKHLIKRILSIDKKQLAQAVAKIAGLTSSLLIIANQLKAFIPLAELIAPAFLAVSGIMLLILGYLAIVVVFGVIVNTAKTLIGWAILGMFMLVVFSLAILAVMLIIAAMALVVIDVDKITQNIDAIFSILEHIIIRVSEPISDKIKEDPKGKDRVKKTGALELLGGLITNGAMRYIGGFIAFSSIIGAVLAVAAIALVVLMLRGIQELNLDRNRVLDNVAIVLDTVDAINDAIWNPKRAGTSDKSKADSKATGFLAGAISIWDKFISTPIGAILSSLITAAYLIISMVSVVAVFLIVLMLRALQELDLKPEEIIKNVNTVMWTCQLIIDSVLTPTDPSANVTGASKSSEKGGIIQWVSTNIPGMGFIARIVEGILAFAYLAVMVFTILALMMVVLMLRLIQTIDLKPELINANVAAVFSTCQYIIDSVFKASEPENGPSSFNAFGKLVSFIYPPLASIINAIFAFVYLAVMTVSILMVMLLAKLLTILATDYKSEDIELGRKLARSILDAAREIQANVFGHENDAADKGKSSGRSFGEKVWGALGSFFGSIPGIKTFSALAGLADFPMMIMGILLVTMLGNLLSKLAIIRVPGIETLGQFARNIIKAAKSISRAVFSMKLDIDLEENAQKQSMTSKILSGIAGLFNGITNSVSALGAIPSLALMLGAIGSLKTLTIALSEMISISIDTEQVKTHLNSLNEIIPLLSESIMIVNRYQPNVDRVSKNLELIKKLHEIIPGLTHVTQQDVKNSKDLTDNYIAFLTKVNSMDLAKLKTTEQLMKHWADMSQSINGNFQGLAQTINEHIMPALKHLDKTMDESMKVQKQIIEDLQKPLDVTQMISNGTGYGSPGETPAGAPRSNTSSPDGDPSSPSYSGTDYVSTGELAYGNATNDFETEKEPIGDGPSFINPYVHNVDKQRKSALERLTKALDGDALRVKIIN